MLGRPPTRSERIEDRLDVLAHHPSVITVARVAKTFGMDPVEVLRDGGNEFLVHLRIASMMVINRDEEEAARKAKRGT